MNTVILILTMGLSAFSQGVIDPNLKLPGQDPNVPKKLQGPASVPGIQDSAKGMSPTERYVEIYRDSSTDRIGTGPTDPEESWEIDSSGNKICRRTVKDRTLPGGGKYTDCRIGKVVGQEIKFNNTRDLSLGYVVSDDGKTRASVGATRVKARGAESEVYATGTVVMTGEKAPKAPKVPSAREVSAANCKAPPPQSSPARERWEQECYPNLPSRQAAPSQASKPAGGAAN